MALAIGPESGPPFNILVLYNFLYFLISSDILWGSFGPKQAYIIDFIGII